MTADRSPTPATFDVFLSYNGKDRPQVEAIAERLRRAGLSPWFDKWSLVPGGDYQPELFAGLQASGACAYFVGPHGEGDWSRMELGVARSRAAKERAFRLFPVLLPGLPEPFDRTTLPPFLSQRTWIDFRGGVHDRAALQALINAISGVPTGLPVVEPEAGRAPYRGLLPFGETDAEFFFGRDADIQRLVEKLRGDRFLAVLGPSGSGKSSVVSAGLVPAIRTGAIGGSEGWPIRALRPGALPLTAIAAELADALGRPAGGVLDELAADERTLHLASEALLRGQAAEARVCWVVDQAEELFTLCHDDAERSLFVANLAYAAAIPGGRTTIVLTIRADFYARLAAHPNLAALVADSQYLVSPLDADGLRAAIEEPAHRVGLEFEEGLIETILDDVVDRPGTLPLLEHALLELWQRRRGTMLTLEGYRASGGVEGALAQRAETTYASFSPAEQGIVRRALLRLTEPGEGTDDTRRRAPMSELIGSPLQAESVATVVNRLADARLVTVSPGVLPADAWVDLSHEALIRGWPRIRAWIDEDRQSLRTLRRLTEAAADWDRAGRDRDLLLRGARLAESIEWRVDREADLNELERAFLDASVEQRDAASRTRDRRRRLVTTISLGLTAVLLGLTVLAGLQWQRADAAASEALRAAALASARQLAAQATSSSTRLDLGLLLSIESGRLSDQVDVRASLLTSLYRDPAVTSFLTGHADAVDSVAFSPDGRTLASGSSDSSVILWDVATRTRIGEPLPSPTGGVYSVAFSPDGRTLAGGTSEDSVILWDVATRSPIGEPLHTQTGVASVAFSPDGRTLASSTNGGIILWDVASRARIGEALTGHGGSVFSVAFSPDGRTLAGGTPDTGVILWDVASRTRIGEPLTGHADRVHSVAFSPDGRTLASGSEDSSVILWDVASRGRIGEPLTGHTGGVHSVAFSPDGRTLASGTSDSSVILWDVATRKPIGEPLGDTEYVFSVAFSPDGRTLASGGSDLVMLWDVATRKPIGELTTGHTNGAFSVAFSPDGRTLASGGQRGYDNSVILWDVATRRPIGEPLGVTEMVFSVAFSPDGMTFASGGSDGVMLWDVATRTPIGELTTGHADDVHSVAFSPDGMTFASGGSDGVMLWDVATRTPIGELTTGDADGVHSVAFSPDGRTLASGGEDSNVILWDVATGKPIGEPLTGDTDGVANVAFSPGGMTFASGGEDNVILWGLDRDDWVTIACRIANRNLSLSEWKHFLGEEPYHETCPGLPRP